MKGVSKTGRRGEDHWLARPATIRLLRKASVAALVMVVLADFAVEHHPTFGIEDTFAFGAWTGFASCAVLIIGAKALGALLQRPDTYYDN